jgi:hypothetical protein
LQQLLQEYDRAPAGTFPFPREVISEYIMRGGANNRFDMPSPIKKVVQSPNESTQQMQPQYFQEVVVRKPRKQAQAKKSARKVQRPQTAQVQAKTKKLAGPVPKAKMP